MALVLVIVGFLLGGLMSSFATRMEIRRTQDTDRILSEARDTLLGFAVAHGRLPCPATANSRGSESFCSSASGACGAEVFHPPSAAPAHGRCSSPFNGFFPARALAFTPIDDGGFAVDAWPGAQNRLRYAVTSANNSAFTASNGMQTLGISNLSPDLHVCTSASGIAATNCGTAVSLTVNAVAIVYSVGKNAASGGVGTDEAANPNPNGGSADAVFVAHAPSPAGASNGEFDDMLTWLSPGLLYSRMLLAGKLP